MPRVLLNAPELKIDKVLFKDRPMPPHCKLERRIVFNLLNHLHKAGFNVQHTFDGEQFEVVTTPTEAMEFIFNLDEVSVRFRKPGFKPEHGVLLVLGNDIDVIADWNYTEGDPDGFDAAMNAFDAEDYA